MKNLEETIALLEEAKKILCVEGGSGLVVGKDWFCDFTPTMEKVEKDINEAYCLLHRSIDEAMTEEFKDEKKISEALSAPTKLFSEEELKIGIVLYACNKLFKISEELKRSSFNFQNVMTPLSSVITDLKKINKMGV